MTSCPADSLVPVPFLFVPILLGSWASLATAAQLPPVEDPSFAVLRRAVPLDPWVRQS